MYKFSGSFAHDRETVATMFSTVVEKVGAVKTSFDNIKKAWVDSSDTKGNELKTEVDNWITKMEKDLPAVENDINGVFTKLENALSDINNSSTGQ